MNLVSCVFIESVIHQLHWQTVDSLSRIVSNVGALARQYADNRMDVMLFVWGSSYKIAVKSCKDHTPGPSTAVLKSPKYVYKFMVLVQSTDWFEETCEMRKALIRQIAPLMSAAVELWLVIYDADPMTFLEYMPHFRPSFVYLHARLSVQQHSKLLSVVTHNLHTVHAAPSLQNEITKFSSAFLKQLMLNTRKEYILNVHCQTLFAPIVDLWLNDPELLAGTRVVVHQDVLLDENVYERRERNEDALRKYYMEGTAHYQAEHSSRMHRVAVNYFDEKERPANESPCLLYLYQLVTPFELYFDRIHGDFV
ncbi:hypothetical protein QR680_000648 [Steinernema hermaphroditum]|uniref:Uncharacterized protein n=1 Tax=Steinernema hermaphroditum TaxID=289476 RepID=A0AA39GVB6_9BILA|nr:hypothetical protein QR680_000648 [Steinernema hermaphroditum]